MAVKTTALSLNYNRLESIPENVLEDPWFQENLLKMHLKQNLLKELSPNLAKMQSLTELYLHSNQLTALPDAIGQLAELQDLNVDANLLVSLNPVVHKLTKLRRLSISRNSLTCLPKELWLCSSLESVDASSNQIAELSPEVMKCKTLRRLCLDRNILTSLPPQLSRLPLVSELSFSGNRLESLPEDPPVKLVVIGNAVLGRTTSLVISYLSGACPPPERRYVPNVLQTWTGHKVVNNTSTEVNIQLWDNTGLGHLQYLESLLVDSNPKLRAVPASLLGCTSLKLVGTAGLSASTWTVDSDDSPLATCGSLPFSLQELAVRQVHMALKDYVTSDVDWIWLPELIPQVLQIPPLLGGLLVPLGYCICGVPYMREKRTVRCLVQEGWRDEHSLVSALSTYLNCPSVTSDFQSRMDCLVQEHSRSVVLELSFCSFKCLHLCTHHNYHSVGAV